MAVFLANLKRLAAGGIPDPPLVAALTVAGLLAMTTARAYRKARGWDVAMDELRRGAGTQWNPQVVTAAQARRPLRSAAAVA